MKTKFVYVLAGAIALGFTALSHAEEKKEGHREGHATNGGPRGGFSPEQIEKRLKEIGLTPADVKDLSPEDRRAKIKEASEKTMADLEKKKEAGTITDAEKETLQHLQNFKKMREQGGGGAGGWEAAKKKYDDLQKKKEAGTLTDAEKEELNKMEERRKQMKEKFGQHHKADDDKK